LGGPQGRYTHSMHRASAFGESGGGGGGGGHALGRGGVGEDEHPRDDELWKYYAEVRTHQEKRKKRRKTGMFM
jgi:hypothetical protein